MSDYGRSRTSPLVLPTVTVDFTGKRTSHHAERDAEITIPFEFEELNTIISACESAHRSSAVENSRPGLGFRVAFTPVQSAR